MAHALLTQTRIAFGIDADGMGQVMHDVAVPHWVTLSFA